MFEVLKLFHKLFIEHLFPDYLITSQEQTIAWSAEHFAAAAPRGLRSNERWTGNTERGTRTTEWNYRYAATRFVSELIFKLCGTNLKDS